LLGHVSIATEPRLVTLNNQIAEIGINQLQGYLESIAVTTQGVTGTTTTALTPGIVKTGFSLYILPKIKGKKVYLQISSDLSSLRNIQVFTAERQDLANGKQGTVSQIELPTVNEKIFNQRSVVESGDTLVIAGFRQVRNETANTRTFGIPSSQGAKKTNLETIVLITPTILG